VIGAAHAGWRGALGDVIDNTVAAMEKLGASRQLISAAVGPCLWQASYEVGPEFPIPFHREDDANSRFFRQSTKRGHFLFDLPSYIAAKLAKAGVSAIEPSLVNTFEDEDKFYSHRRGYIRGVKEEGRMISCIMLV
jgi:hypothetical protein